MDSFYARYIKRIMDFTMSLAALIVLSPLLLLLTVTGAIAMKGSPFFVQPRPGKDEKVFRLLKFRTMTNEKDADGNLLPDEQRLNRYGSFLRKTSMDELPELLNILNGDLSLVGPRPLLVEYLPRYSEKQRHRHSVMPGLTGYAQVHGRNSVTWEEKFAMDLWYTENISFALDVKIVFETLKTVLSRKGICSATSVTMEEFMGAAEVNT